MNAEAGKLRTQAEIALFKALEAGKKKGGLNPLQKEAVERLQKHGLPHRRIEAWKYTDLRTLLKDIPPQGEEGVGKAADQAKQPSFFIPADLTLHVLNGFAQTIPAALPPGVLADRDFAPSGEAFHADENANVDLNTVFSAGGYHLTIKAQDKAPVLLIDHYLAGENALMSACRHRVSVETGGKALLIERFSGRSGLASLSSAGIEIEVKQGGELTHIRVVQEGEAASHLGVVGARLAKEARYNPFVMTLGTRLVRTDMQITFQGRDAHAGIRGATLLKGQEHTDLTLAVEHGAPDCTSVEQFKSVVDERATAVFQGKIMVSQEAQKTDAQMMSQGLLLSETGSFLNKPELEIFADDVVCAHGATCGQLDEELLFYLLARGLPKRQAETMLVQAFVAETIEATGEPVVIEALEKLLESWLSERASTSIL